MSRSKQDNSNLQATIRRAPGIRLQPTEIALLRQAFQSSEGATKTQSIFVEREFRSGYSGALVLLVSLDSAQAPIVVKLAHPYDLQSEYNAYHQYVEKSAPQNTARLQGPPIIAENGQLGALLYTFAGGNTHLPTNDLKEYLESKGAEATVAMLNRLFRVYGRHWWAINRAEKFVLGEHYDHLLPVHLEVKVLEAQVETEAGEAATLVAGEASVVDVRPLKIGDTIRIQNFRATKTKRQRGTITLQANPPAEEAAPSLRIRLLWPGEIVVEAGQIMHDVSGTVSATRLTLLTDAACQAMPTYVPDDETVHLDLSVVDQMTASLLENVSLRNPLQQLDSLLDRVLEARVSTLHGDLNLNNVLADSQTGFAWLIDFADTRVGPTLFDLQRLEVQIFIKLLAPRLMTSAPKGVPVEPYGTAVAVALMKALHVDPPLPTSPLTDQQGLYTLLVGIRRLARQYLMDDQNWDEYYLGLTVALVGALKFDELEALSRAVTLTTAATAKGLIGVPLAPTPYFAELAAEPSRSSPASRESFSSTAPSTAEHKARPHAAMSNHDGSQGAVEAASIRSPETQNEPILLNTKFYRPHLRTTCVARPRLRRILDWGLNEGWILIVAAAGMGKTTLITEWTDPQIEQTCWLSLDKADDELTRFFTYLIGAIRERRPEVTEGLSELLQASHPDAIENLLNDLVDLLLNRLAQLNQPLIIVLDDYHNIENKQIHEAMTRLLTHSPPLVTFVLLTRSDPPLPLARMRVMGRLTEVRRDGLAFTQEEATHFFNDSFGLGLSAEQVDALTARTEGWSAGLQMAALALQTHVSDRSSFIHNFTGSHRHVLDYLMEEVLRVQTQSVRDFMMRIAPLHQFNVALSNAVLDESAAKNAAVMLDYLEVHNLFLIPLDDSRQWYRYHHLFAELLRGQLDKAEPTAVRQVQERAAKWYESQGDHEQAIDYALAAQAHEFASDLIQARLTTTMWQTALSTWQRWHNLLPSDFLVKNPMLAVTLGQALAVSGRVQDAIPLWREIDPSSVPLPSYLMREFLNVDERHDRDSFAVIAREAQSQPLDQVTQIMLAFIWSSAGDYRMACGMVDAAAVESQRVGDDFSSWMALVHQCRLYALLGELDQAYEFIQTALTIAQSLPPALHDLLGIIYVARVRVHLARNELDDAKRYAQQALQQVDETGFVMGVLPAATMLLAETLQAQGHIDAAQAEAERALDLARRFDFPSEYDWLQAYQVQMQLREGNLAAATAWLAQRRPLPPSRFYPLSICRLVEAQIYLAQNQPSRAINLLTELTTEPANLYTADAWLLLALARQAAGDEQQAFMALTTAISIAEPQKNVRAFLNQADHHAKLLVRLLTHFSTEHPENRFVQSLLSLLSVSLHPGSEENL
ncbi:MAG: AAA family ATPase [Chloroflexota bacterium]